MLVQTPTQAWSETTLTFNNQPAPWNSMNPSYPFLATSPDIEASVDIYKQNNVGDIFIGQVSIDITELYQEWRNESRPNYGLVYSREQLFCENTNANSVASSDNEDELKRPALEIIYQQ